MSAADGAADAQVRRVLRAAGETIGARGRISDEQYDRYNELSGAATPPPRAGVGAAADAAGDWTAGLDDDGGSWDAGGGGGPITPPVPDAAPAVPLLEAEQAPRAVRQQPGPSPAARIRARFAGGKDTPPAGQGKAKGSRQQQAKAKAKARAAQPWRPTAGVIGDIWRRAAMSAGGIPALQRILAAQAPMAGVALEGALRGSIVDKVLLQPAARWEQQADTVAAMAGVPVLVALISVRGQQLVTPDGKPVIKPDGSPALTPGTEMMMGGLKTCLISWLAVSEQHAGDVIHQAEETLRLGAQADEIIRWIFSPPVPGQSFDDVAADAAEHAPWAPRAGQPAPSDQGPDQEAPPPARGGASSAFAPALTGSVLPRGARP